MEQIINNQGFQHIVEKIFLPLKCQDLLVCELINKSSKNILGNLWFWHKKWIIRGLSEKNQEDWGKAIELSIKNWPELEQNVLLYQRKVLRNDHGAFVDIPCYSRLLIKLKDVHQLTNDEKLNRLRRAAIDGIIDLVKILAPLTTNPNAPNEDDVTAIHYAAKRGHVEIINILASFTINPNFPSHRGFGYTPIYWAAYWGHPEVIKVLAPLTSNPNAPAKDVNPSARKETPMQIALERGHQEVVNILSSYVQN